MRYNNDVIGLFPLRLFLLQQERTTLHINESRFLQLIYDCVNQDAYFGIPYHCKTKLHEYGCVVKVVEITQKYSNGNLDVVVECVQNFKLNSFEAQKVNCLYPSGQLTLLDNTSITPNEELLALANSYNQLLFEKETEEEALLDIQHIISLLSLEDEEKLKLFKFNSLKKIQFLIHKLKFMSVLVRQERLVAHQYHLN